MKQEVLKKKLQYLDNFSKFYLHLIENTELFSDII